jgi:NAD-dependent deacetylase
VITRSESPTTAADLALALRTTPGSGLVVVVTGAGVSAASGLPTFRTGPDAIWRRDDLEMGTAEFFHAHPVEHWRWYLERFAGILDVAPNPAHRALAALERWRRERSGGRLLLVTQNIDVLHERAGSRDLIKIHGSADRVRCARTGCRLGAPGGSIPLGQVDLAPFRDDPSLDTLPRCPECGSPLRAHALFFDEIYDSHVDYGFARARRAFEEMSLALFVGTSFAVGITEIALRTTLFQRVPAWSVDPNAAGETRFPWLKTVAEPAEVALPAVCRSLGIDGIDQVDQVGDDAER